MKYDVSIKFYSNDLKEISSADKVELLGVGSGVLSVIKGNTNSCFNLENIMRYTITEVDA